MAGLTVLANVRAEAFPRVRSWLRWSTSPAIFRAILGETDSLEPILANVQELRQLLLGFGKFGPFQARIRNGPTVEFPPHYGPRLLSTNILLMIRETWVDHAYTPPGFEISEDETIVDVGANIGVFSLFASQCAPTGRVIAYEPIPDVFGLLKRNLMLNQAGNVRAHRTGVLGQRGSARIWYNPINVGGHSIYATRVGVQHPVDVSVEFITLDDIFSSNGLHVIDLLKFDCEGSEYSIFEGCSNAALRKVKRIAVEYHAIPGSPERLVRLIERLRELDFRTTTKRTDDELCMLWARRD